MGYRPGVLRLRIAIPALLCAVTSSTAGAVVQPSAATDLGEPASSPSVQVMYRTPAPFPYVADPDVRFTLDAFTDAGRSTRFDVRVSRTPMRSVRRSTWTYPERQQGLLPATGRAGRGPGDVRAHVRLRVAQGQVLCVSARATDSSGVVGAWSDRSCVIRFLDESRLRGHGDLRADRGERYYQGTATHIYPGGSLVLRGVPRSASVLVLYERRRQAEAPTRSIRTTGSGSHPQHGDCGLGQSSSFGRWRLLDECPDRTERRGPITFHTDRELPSYGVDGVVVVPAWAR